MKFPSYIDAKPDWKTMTMNVKVKKWGMPILLFKALKKNFTLKWYQWLLYPYLCFKIMAVKT
jgi:hypothetical protein